MIDIKSELLLTFGQAARRLPRRRQGKQVHPTTIWRWHRRGGWNGAEKVHLEAVKLPGGLTTSAEAIARFVSRLSGPSAEPFEHAAPAFQTRAELVPRARQGPHLGGLTTLNFMRKICAKNSPRL